MPAFGGALEISVIVFLFSCLCLRAGNPILPESFYADPEPHVWNDGNIYIYGSRDEDRNYYCSDRYHFIYSSDLMDWTDPGISFSVRDLPPDSGTRLYACDCAFKNGLYYLYISTGESRKNKPTCIGYATGPTPLGPFAYRVVIIDNIGCDPGVWNNHGRIVDFKGQWYVFYHRSIQDGKSPRQTSAEPIHFDDQGMIREVKMTSTGMADPLDLCGALRRPWRPNFREMFALIASEPIGP